MGSLAGGVGGGVGASIAAEGIVDVARYTNALYLNYLFVSLHIIYF